MRSVAVDGVTSVVAFGENAASISTKVGQQYRVEQDGEAQLSPRHPEEREARLEG